MTESTWMIYGANGYTGKLAARLASQLGETPILAGRNARQVKALAGDLGMRPRVFDLRDPARVSHALEDINTVVHCAGPFSATSAPMLDACIASGTHYVDITGEISVFETIFARDAEIQHAGIVALPGAGMDVVPTDCLAAMLKREVPHARKLKLALYWRNAKLSPGTSKTMVEAIPQGGKVRRDGKIVTVPPAWKVETHRFQRDLSMTCVSIPWGDVATAFYSTGIPDIDVYAAVTPRQLRQMKPPLLVRRLTALQPVQAIIKKLIGTFVRGPDDGQRARADVLIYGEASDDSGNKAELWLHTVEGYTFTAESAVRAAMRLAAGGIEPGAKTPSMAFGADFVLQVPGSRLERQPP